VGDSAITAAFRGIPGLTYQVQRSLDLITWTNLSTVTADANGLVTLTDTFNDQGGVIPPTAYYRLVWNP
jgi:hypothetical protein